MSFLAPNMEGFLDRSIALRVVMRMMASLCKGRPFRQDGRGAVPAVPPSRGWVRSVSSAGETSIPYSAKGLYCGVGAMVLPAPGLRNMVHFGSLLSFKRKNLPALALALGRKDCDRR